MTSLQTPNVVNALARKPNVKVRYRDLSVTDPVFRQKLLSIFDRILQHGQLIMGGEVVIFEETVARYCGTKYSVGVSSGTSAIYLALRALGIGPGDEVITTPMSWIATLNAITATGAKPIFADVRSDLNIDPAAVDALCSERTRAIVPVHYTGRICDMDSIMATARKFGTLVVEDASQAMGASLADGRAAGGFGHAGAFSLNPMKVLAGFGDAGVVTSSDSAAVEKIRSLRYLGTVNQETCTTPELNHKIDSIQAAFLCESFTQLPDMIASRRRIAQRYDEGLRSYVSCPSILESGNRAIFFDYTIQAENRDALQFHLAQCGVESKIRHPILMPDQPAYFGLPKAEIPVARQTVKKILSLPCHEKMTEEHVDYVIESVRTFYEPA